MTNNKNTYFFPLSSKPRRHTIATFDTEGNGSPNGFVCAAVCSDGGDYSFSTRSETLEFLISARLRNSWIVSHNLEYDLGVLTAGDLRRFRCLFVNSRILYAEYRDEHNHTWKFVDSTNLFPGASVKELGEMVGTPKLDLPPHVQAHLNAGRPLTDLDPPDRYLVTRYNLIDAQILREAVGVLQDELHALGGELKTTISGCSMDLFRRKFMRHPWSVVPPEINAMARQGYYGARVEPYAIGRVSGVNGYDVSSLYPSIMSTANYPHPGALSFETYPFNYSRLLDKEGVAMVLMDIPEIDPPPLPVRVNKHLFFPTGLNKGVWTTGEIRHAIANGATLLSCDWLCWSGLTFNPFEEFINTLYNMKVLSASDSPVKVQVYKALLNHSYGRFGINPEGGLQELVSIDEDTDLSTMQGGEFYLLNGWPYILNRLAQDEQPPYANAFFAAQITANARIKMHGLIKEYLNDLIYTDTDSLWSTDTISTSPGLGELRETHSALDLLVLAPKEYAVFSGEHLVEVRAKGIPHDHKLEYITNGQATFERPIKIQEALNTDQQFATWREVHKQRQDSWPKRSPVLGSKAQLGYFQTRPWSSAELKYFLQGSSAREYQNQLHLEQLKRC